MIKSDFFIHLLLTFPLFKDSSLTGFCLTFQTAEHVQTAICILSHIKKEMERYREREKHKC